MIKIMLVDDHRIVRDGLKLVLEDEENIEIVGEADNGQEALENIANQEIDVILLDITMPVMNGLETAKILNEKYPKINVLMLSMHDNEQYVLKSIEHGAKGYLLKDSPRNEIIEAVNMVANGERYFNNPVSGILVQGYLRMLQKQSNASQETDKPNPFSKREKQVLQLLKDGMNNKNIAEKLTLSIRTVEVHRFNMMKKIKAKNVIELLNISEHNGWV